MEVEPGVAPHLRHGKVSQSAHPTAVYETNMTSVT